MFAFSNFASILTVLFNIFFFKNLLLTSKINNGKYIKKSYTGFSNKYPNFVQNRWRLGHNQIWAQNNFKKWQPRLCDLTSLENQAVCQNFVNNSSSEE